jgi:hypothetical protein
LESHRRQVGDQQRLVELHRRVEPPGSPATRISTRPAASDACFYAAGGLVKIATLPKSVHSSVVGVLALDICWISVLGRLAVMRVIIDLRVTKPSQSSPVTSHRT